MQGFLAKHITQISPPLPTDQISLLATLAIAVENEDVSDHEWDWESDHTNEGENLEVTLR